MYSSSGSSTSSNAARTRSILARCDVNNNKYNGCDDICAHAVTVISFGRRYIIIGLGPFFSTTVTCILSYVCARARARVLNK